MIAILLISLAKAAFILPCHLEHVGAKSDAPLARVGRSAAGFVLYPLQRFEQVWERVNGWADRGLNFFIEHIYSGVCGCCASFDLHRIGSRRLHAVGAVPQAGQ
jgi:hypothetical protein